MTSLKLVVLSALVVAGNGFLLGQDGHDQRPHGHMLGGDGHDQRPHGHMLGGDGHDQRPHGHILGGDGHDQRRHHLLGANGHGIWRYGQALGVEKKMKKKLGKILGRDLDQEEAHELMREFPTLLSTEESKQALKELQHHSNFKAFVQTHGKNYANEKEYGRRYKIFKQNMKKVQFLRETERGTGQYGVTPFADMTEKEFRTQKLGLKQNLAKDAPDWPEADIPDVSLPKSIDWRKMNAVTPVKNQGQCGSCWAFSVTGNVEGQWSIRRGKLLSLSEQELVDCDKLDQGCNGGLPSNAYEAILELGGLELEEDYSYDGEDEVCHFNKTKVRAVVTGGLKISQNETQMAQWLTKNGPISIGLNANAMQFYMGGVSHPFKFLCSPKSIDHGVLIVGYGIHHYPMFKKDLPFWIVKNSWGTGWGEQGYYRVYRGDGTCGLNMMATTATIS